jgi:uncharacterized protein YggT (Ycf19 family)
MYLVPPTSLPALLADVIEVLIILIIIEAVISNIIAFGGKLSPYHPFVKFVRAIVNPILNPFRRLLPSHKTQGWDLSPLFAIFLLQILRSYLY